MNDEEVVLEEEIVPEGEIVSEEEIISGDGKHRNSDLLESGIDEYAQGTGEKKKKKK